MAGKSSRKASPCPFCGGPVPRMETDFRPFCSERCKLQDLGMWVSGRYAIPGPPLGADAGDEEGDPGEEQPAEEDPTEA